MRELASAYVLRAELDPADLVAAGVASDRADLEGVPRNGDDIKIVQINGIARVSHDCADVTGEEILILAHAENQRRTAAGSDKEIFDISVNEGDAVGADHLFQRCAGRVHQPSFGILPAQLLIDVAD